LLRSESQAIPSALILAGDRLFLGSDGVISAVSAASREEQWSTQVEVRVYGLVAANDRLFASTDQGHIYSFITLR
jgi:outer membrane protein assembly factor BamB